ncbi:MAG: hypothetical protein U9N43_02380, partial [Euryarchaeota archaeon]|nr:hypothetical protein [Euryarchaeota archaeon]
MAYQNYVKSPSSPMIVNSTSWFMGHYQIPLECQELQDGFAGISTCKSRNCDFQLFEQSKPFCSSPVYDRREVFL